MIDINKFYCIKKIIDYHNFRSNFCKMSMEFTTKVFYKSNCSMELIVFWFPSRCINSKCICACIPCSFFITTLFIVCHPNTMWDFLVFIFYYFFTSSTLLERIILICVQSTKMSSKVSNGNKVYWILTNWTRRNLRSLRYLKTHSKLTSMEGSTRKCHTINPHPV